LTLESKILDLKEVGRRRWILTWLALSEPLSTQVVSGAAGGLAGLSELAADRLTVNDTAKILMSLLKQIRLM
jgi:hypothetical protein